MKEKYFELASSLEEVDCCFHKLKIDDMKSELQLQVE